LFKYEKYVFGISLGSKNFTDTKRIEACIKWISENFKSCLLLVTDSIYRLTIEVRQGRERHEAWLEAIHTGEEFVNKNSLLFEEYSESCQFYLKRTSEMLERSDFSIYYEELQNLYQKNQSFQSMVNSFVEVYLNRVELVEAEQVETLRQKYLAITYFFEESAINACLVKEGWKVFVYPGSIKTFEEISEGLHPEVPEPLKQVIWASLRLKKQNAKIEDKKSE